MTPDLVRSWPVDVLMSNDAASRPSEAIGQRVARIGVRRRDGQPNGRARRRGCTHSPRRARAIVNTGGLFAPGALVVPNPEFDQSLVPSAFVARTSTS